VSALKAAAAALAEDQLREPVKHGLDVVAVGAFGASLADVITLQGVTGILVALWTAARLVESVLAIRAKIRGGQ
jgi:hypothetical protein